MKQPFGQIMRAARLKRRMSASDLGGRIGASASCISDYERGEHMPGIDRAQDIMDVLGVKLVIGRGGAVEGRGLVFEDE